MTIFEVTFSYFSDGESGNDKFSFASHDEAQAKFDEHRAAIEQEFGGCTNADRIDETGTFGIMDRDCGSWARVCITNRQRNEAL